MTRGYDFAEATWLVQGTLNQVDVSQQLQYVKDCRRLGCASQAAQKAIFGRPGKRAMGVFVRGREHDHRQTVSRLASRV